MIDRESAAIWRQAYRRVDSRHLAESQDAFSEVWRSFVTRGTLPTDAHLLEGALAEIVRRKRQFYLFGVRAPVIPMNPHAMTVDRRFSGIGPKLATANLSALEHQEAA